MALRRTFMSGVLGCAVAVLTSGAFIAHAGQPPTTEAAQPPGPESASGQTRFQAAVDEADRLLAEAQSALAAARLWMDRHLSGESVDSLAAKARAQAEAALAEALEKAAAEHRQTLGVRVYERFELDGNSTWQWTPIAESQALGDRVVLLVHGLDEPGDIWNDLAPRLAEAGHVAVRFDYPNDQSAAASADLLFSALADLRARGVERVDIVAHSMGGLIARDVLTRETMYAGSGAGDDVKPTVARLITIGTPNHGSPWAALRGFSEVRDQFIRWINSDGSDCAALLGFLVDGEGEAGRDLMPGSAYLNELNARAGGGVPRDVAMTLIVGRASPMDGGDVRGLLAYPWVRRALGAKNGEDLALWVDSMAGQLGDGVVPESSAVLAGVSDIVYVNANHRSMIRRIAIVSKGAAQQKQDDDPPGIGIVLDRLRADARPAP